ncbi:hypothetical protein CYLTODRAFT_194824 [Cylindrobasidium torrendii FP15055 ss-10]|uniref:Uncharacterized protein n=1 Tax=Cylindrobasidium torrendii FP15055 ss-10 TaxID=1314674 RepID=A0A0D7BTF2_9AGAR|nr:hypothetical protein CYLTODRAFT_194824 [Cylindrobasidium torrendii FP15055 ss-10]
MCHYRFVMEVWACGCIIRWQEEVNCARTNCRFSSTHDEGCQGAACRANGHWQAHMQPEHITITKHEICSLCTPSGLRAPGGREGVYDR